MKKKTTYHHGALREALLAAAEKILIKQGLYALTLRAIAREAGVSHGAPAHHFGDLTGLLSDLAAIGYRRFGAKLRSAIDADPKNPRLAGDRAYVAFALENPEMFSLMFRSDRIDTKRHSIVDARTVTLGILAEVNAPAEVDRRASKAGALKKAATMAETWCTVHGFAVLAIDNRLNALLEIAPDGTTIEGLFNAMLDGMAKARVQRRPR